MKLNLNFYRYLLSSMKMINYKPKFVYSKNVQGYWFTRNYTIYFCVWALTLTITIHSDFNVKRSIAHEMNVKKYMLSKKDKKIFFDNIINPPKPNKALLNATKNHNKKIK